MWKCSCGHKNGENYSFCATCGKPRTQTQYADYSAKNSTAGNGRLIVILLCVCAVLLTALLVISLIPQSSPSAASPAVTASVPTIKPQPASTPKPSSSAKPASAPETTAAPKSTPSQVYTQKSVGDYLIGFSSKIDAPEADSILDAYQTKYVVTNYGNHTFLYSGSSSGEEIAKLPEGSMVTVLAVENGRSLVAVNNTALGGWTNSKFLCDSYYSGPNPSDTANLPEGVDRPVKDDYISSYETMYVRSKYGNRIYLLNKPDLHSDTDPAEIIGYVDEAEAVTVLARRSGYSFVICGDGRGWCSSSLLVYTY